LWIVDDNPIVGVSGVPEHLNLVQWNDFVSYFLYISGDLFHFLCEHHTFAPSNRPGLLARPMRVQSSLGAFASCAARARELEL
jgi:hypothetical protein